MRSASSHPFMGRSALIDEQKRAKASGRRPVPPRGRVPAEERTKHPGLVTLAELARSKRLLNLSGSPVTDATIRTCYFKGRIEPAVLTASGHPLFDVEAVTLRWRERYPDGYELPPAPPDSGAEAEKVRDAFGL